MSGQSELLDRGQHNCPDCGERWECFLHSDCTSFDRVVTPARCPDCIRLARELKSMLTLGELLYIALRLGSEAALCLRSKQEAVLEDQLRYTLFHSGRL